jgi:uncharacterized cofD-like protein
MTVDLPAGSAKTSIFFRRATFATALWLYQKMSTCFRACSSTDSPRALSTATASATCSLRRFAQAVQTSSQILATRGRIYPSTTANATLSARMDDGSIVRGETNITASRRSILELMLSPADACPLPETLDAIAAADLITLGPGSLYTSLITNLLVRGIPKALAKSRASRIYICNLMTQANESLGLTASQHIERILDHAGEQIFDYALVNTAPIHPQMLAKYAREGQTPILADLDRIRLLGLEPITGNFVHEGDVLRHSYDLVAEAVLQLALRRQPHLALRS